MKYFWALFFIVWPIVAIACCWIAPANGWWFPGPPEGTMGDRIEDLFNMILIITTITFVGTQVALGFVMLKAAMKDQTKKAWYSHGSHSLELIWTIVPSGILLFIALYQLNTWADFRIQNNAPDEVQNNPIAVVTARQFEWRIRYPEPGHVFKNKVEVNEWVRNPQPGDLYAVNELHVPVGQYVKIYLKSQDVQHSFFIPKLRIKQDAVPGMAIPVWFETTEMGEKEFLCAELCGWGHFKMKARIIAETEKQQHDFLIKLQREQAYDGVTKQAEETASTH